jgi:hypothetical protein
MHTHTGPSSCKAEVHGAQEAESKGSAAETGKSSAIPAEVITSALEAKRSEKALGCLC